MGAENQGTKSVQAHPVSDLNHVRHGELLYMMHELSRLISTYSDVEMGKYGLTHSQWWALMHITLHEGKSQSELARIMQMGRAAASKLFERLEAKGWIERRLDPSDSRVLRIHSAEAAVPATDVMRQHAVRQFALLLDGISVAEEQAVLAGLRRIKANAEAAIAAQHRKP